MRYVASVVADDPMRDGIQVVIGLRGDENTRALVVTEIGQSGIVQDQIPWNTVAPSLHIPNEIARPLLDALAQHYGGTADTRTLRSDYVAERARVDKLIDAVIQR